MDVETIAKALKGEAVDIAGIPADDVREVLAVLADAVSEPIGVAEINQIKNLI